MDRITLALLEDVSPTLVEYGVRELFKGKSVKSAAKTVVKKFNGQTNLFLGTVNDLTVEAVEDAIWARIIAQVTKNIAGYDDPARIEQAMLGTLDFWKQAAALPELKRRMGRS